MYAREARFTEDVLAGFSVGVMKDPLRKYRRQFRRWVKTAHLKRESRFYDHLFESRKCAVSDEQDIRSKVVSRFSNLAPKSKGNLNSIAIYHHYNWENDSLRPALQKFGPVRHYDWGDRLDHSRGSRKQHLKRQMNDHLIHQIEQWRVENPPDVIFAYLSRGNVGPDTLPRLRDLEVPMVNISLNDK